MSVELKIPALGESISEATLVKWLKQVGDTVATDEPVAELETDKITVTLPAPQGGTLTVQKHPIGAVVKIGDSIGTISTGSITKSDSAKAAATASSSAPSAATSVIVATPQTIATPSQTTGTPQTAATGSLPQSKTAFEGTLPAQVALQTGAKGPALPPSKRQALREQGSETSRPKSEGAPTKTYAAASTAQASQSTSAPREEVVPMSPMRKRIAERLVEAQHTAAVLTTFNEVDMTNIMALRSKYQEEFTKKYGIKLGFMSFFAKACAFALKAFPGLNAELRGNDIIYKKHYDFGIAVGSGKGLVVPVVRNVDLLTLAQIEKIIAELAQKAKDNKLTLDDLLGGTFSITNGGIYGSMMSTPLLNLPQTGILGMHNIIRRPIAVGDTIEIRPMMYLALSYDHRVVDGREAVQCLVHIKERLESPDKLLLEI